MRNRFVLVAAAALCQLPAAAAIQAAGPLDRYEFLQIEMGVPFRIVLYAPDEVSANKASRAAYARIKQLNAVMSDYDPDSELMQLCRESRPGRPVQVSKELQHVLAHALRVSEETDGAFDVTIGPVVRLWRIARRQKTLPAADALAAALQQVGYRHVLLDPKQHTVELRQENMRLDLGGIAKGYAADEALKVLKSHGITRALINGSGDIVAGDPPPHRTHWLIEVASPTRKPTGGVPSESAPPANPLNIKLANAAVATSGDAFQYVEIDGKRYSHIIDPATGLGLTQSSSVTVIAENGITADSLASAVSVLGPENGLKLIEQSKRRAALVVTLKNEQPQRYATDSFARFVFRTRIR